MPYIQQLLNEGGPIMYVISACSILAFFIILGRLFHLHRAQIDVQEFIHGLFNVLKRNNVVEAVAICDETPGPVAHVLRAAILSYDKDEAAIRNAAEEVSLSEVPRLEHNIRLLATLAYITPLLGLLGTVTGMIGAFDSMQEGGPFVGTVLLAKDVRMALLTTAAGLSVSIACCVFHNFLVGRVESLVLDMEKAAREMVYFLTHQNIKPDNMATRGEEEPGSSAPDED